MIKCSTLTSNTSSFNGCPRLTWVSTILRSKVVRFHDINPGEGTLILIWNSVRIRWGGRCTPTTTPQKSPPPHPPRKKWNPFYKLGSSQAAQLKRINVVGLSLQCGRVLDGRSSYSCNHHLCYDGDRLGRVKIGQDLLAVLNRYLTFTPCQNAACSNNFFFSGG